MTNDDAVVAVLDALESIAVPYMVVGSLASNFYGVPRATRDADFVLQLKPGQLQELVDALPAPLALQKQSSFEGVTATRRFVIELAKSPFVCELFLLSDDPHDQERFSRRTRVRMLDREVSIASPEDVIITKLRWADDVRRPKDREDVRNILALNEERLDLGYIHHWVTEHHTSELFESIRRSIVES